MIKRAKSPRTVMGIGWMALAAVAFLATACSQAAAPGAGPAAGLAPQSEARAVKYSDDMVDLAAVPEPPVHQAGGIPPADLTAQPKYGGKLTISQGCPILLDPHFDLAACSAFPHRVYANGLLRWDAKCGCPQPDLAESWKVAPDGMYYDFKIRKGVKFHNRPPVNGREVTVQDIKWSMDRVSGLEERPGKQGIFFRRYENVKEFRILDDSTLRMVMKQVDSQILAEVMHDYMAVLPKEAAINDSYEDWHALIGSGAFIVEFAEAPARYRLVRNPDYWEQDQAGRKLPYLDRMELTGTLDPAAQVAGLKSGQIDMTFLLLRLGQSFFNDPDYRVYSGRGLVNGTIGVFMNNTLAPFNDIRVRRAVHLALDREEYIKVTGGGPDGGYVLTHLGGWPQWHWPEQKIWSLPGYAKGADKDKEREEARRLLEQAGYAKGFTIDFYSAEGAGTEVIMQHLGLVGIKTNLKVVTGTNNRYASFMKDKPATFAGAGGGHTPDYGITQALLCNSVQNMSLYCNPKIDELFLAERSERDSGKRHQMLDQMQQILNDDMPFAPLTRNVTFHVVKKHVRGWRNFWYDIQSSNGYQGARMWLDK